MPKLIEKQIKYEISLDEMAKLLADHLEVDPEDINLLVIFDGGDPDSEEGAAISHYEVVIENED